MIDLRSDTVTKPSKEMIADMVSADVGDDVYGEDPTVNQLEILAAEILGTDDSLFTPTGTQSNLLALLTHCQRGDEYIAGDNSHCYRYEGGGAAALGGIQPQPLPNEPDGTVDLTRVEQTIKPECDIHYAHTRLFCLENTYNGKILPLTYLSAAAQLSKRKSLLLHLDGARLFNAAVKLQVPPRNITNFFNSISFCLSKGLGAPIGSMLCGSTEFIQKARKWRKTVGGGMRQVGIVAAAGIYALTHNIDRLEEDHNQALILAHGLSSIDELHVDLSSVQTNMVFFSIDTNIFQELQSYLQKQGIVLDGISCDGTIRLVTHMDITEEDISFVIQCMKNYFFTKNK